MLSTVCLAGAFYCFYEASVAMQCIRFKTRRIKRLEILEGAAEAMKSLAEIKEIEEKHMAANPKLYEDIYIPPTILHTRVRREYLEARR